MERAGIRLDRCVTALYGVYEGETLLALGGTAGSAIRSLAGGRGLSGRGAFAAARDASVPALKDVGVQNVFVNNKPRYAELFSSLCFTNAHARRTRRLLESVPQRARALPIGPCRNATAPS
jgi:citrate lyase synthetase